MKNRLTSFRQAVFLCLEKSVFADVSIGNIVNERLEKFSLS
jgi:hypothetical protein